MVGSLLLGVTSRANDEEFKGKNSSKEGKVEKSFLITTSVTRKRHQMSIKVAQK